MKSRWTIALMLLPFRIWLEGDNYNYLSLDFGRLVRSNDIKLLNIKQAHSYTIILGIVRKSYPYFCRIFLARYPYFCMIFLEAKSGLVPPSCLAARAVLPHSAILFGWISFQDEYLAAKVIICYKGLSHEMFNLCFCGPQSTLWTNHNWELTCS
jgi:hypothetical protein